MRDLVYRTILAKLCNLNRGISYGAPTAYQCLRPMPTSIPRVSQTQLVPHPTTRTPHLVPAPAQAEENETALSKVLLLWSPSLLKAPHLQPELSDKAATYSFIYSTSLALLVQAFCTQVSLSSMALDEGVQVVPTLGQTLTSHHSWTSGPSGCQ